jgi:hypothetical protein
MASIEEENNEEAQEEKTNRKMRDVAQVGTNEGSEQPAGDREQEEPKQVAAYHRPHKRF